MKCWSVGNSRGSNKTNCPSHFSFGLFTTETTEHTEPGQRGEENLVLICRLSEAFLLFALLFSFYLLLCPISVLFVVSVVDMNFLISSPSHRRDLDKVNPRRELSCCSLVEREPAVSHG